MHMNKTKVTLQLELYQEVYQGTIINEFINGYIIDQKQSLLYTSLLFHHSHMFTIISANLDVTNVVTTSYIIQPKHLSHELYYTNVLFHHSHECLLPSFEQR